MNEQDRQREETSRLERQQAEERARSERAAQEERQRQEEQRRQDERRREDANRQAEERRRQEQTKQEEQRRQQTVKKQGEKRQDTATQESSATTLHEKTKENAQAQYAKDKGVPYVSTGSVVNDMTRNISSVQRAEYDRRAGRGKEPEPKKEQVQAKESPAMQKYKAQQAEIKERVVKHRESKEQGNNQSQSYGRKL